MSNSPNSHDRLKKKLLLVGCFESDAMIVESAQADLFSQRKLHLVPMKDLKNLPPGWNSSKLLARRKPDKAHRQSFLRNPHCRSQSSFSTIPSTPDEILGPIYLAFLIFLQHCYLHCARQGPIERRKRWTPRKVHEKRHRRDNWMRFEVSSALHTSRWRLPCPHCV